MKRLGAICLSVLLLCACSEQAAPLRLHSVVYQQLDIDALRDSLQDLGEVEIERDEAPPTLSPLEVLSGDHADLTVVENSTPFRQGIRTVIPLYRSVLHLLVRDGVSLEDRRQGGEPVTLYVVNNSHAGRTFVNLIAQRRELLPDPVRLVTELVPGETDAIVYFGPISPGRTPWYRSGYHLASLADAGPAAAEFFQQGVSLLVPQLHAMEIPALTYSLPGNERPLQSLWVSTLLVTRAGADENQIYHLTRMLVEQRPLFAALEPDVFSWVSEHFDQEKLNFPLHAGSRRYLERDEPGLLERYADAINLVIYLGILLVTGLAGFMRWRSQRKKNRVDTFYSRLLQIRERAAHEPRDTLLAEVRALELEAYQLLIEEKLAADDSFRIFTDLLASVSAELKTSPRV